jgi:uncharacterized protein (AIM24 family)
VTIAFGTIGALSAGGTTTISVAMPTGGAAGDMYVCGRCVWLSSAGLATNESGWTPGGDLHGGTGTTADAHTGRARIDYRSDAVPTDPTVFDQSGTLSGAVGRCARYTKTTAAWDTPATATGTDNTHGTNRSVTASASISLQPGDMLIAAVAVDTDVSLAALSAAFTASGITFGTTTVRSPGAGVGTGNDGNVLIVDALVTAGTATVAPVLTLTTSTSQCGPVSFLRLREVPDPPVVALDGSAEVVVDVFSLSGPAGIRVDRPLDGSAEVVVEGTGNMVVAQALAGNAEVVVDTAGSLAVARPLAGDSEVVVDTAGSLAVARPLSGSAEVVVEGTGDLTVTGSGGVAVALDGQAEIVVEVFSVAPLLVARGLDGQAELIVETAAADLTVPVAVALDGQAEIVFEAGIVTMRMTKHQQPVRGRQRRAVRIPS